MRKAQSSVETLIVLGIASAMLLPAAYMFYSFLLHSTAEIVEAQVNSIGHSFLENANLVYNYGTNAKVTAEYEFPDRILNMTLEKNRLVFYVDLGTGERSYEYPFSHNVTGTFNESAYSQGKKTFEFATILRGESVLIQKI